MSLVGGDALLSALFLQQICNNNCGGLLQTIAATAVSEEKNVVKSMVF